MNPAEEKRKFIELRELCRKDYELKRNYKGEFSVKGDVDPYSEIVRALDEMNYLDFDFDRNREKRKSNNISDFTFDDCCTELTFLFYKEVFYHSDEYVTEICGEPVCDATSGIFYEALKDKTVFKLLERAVEVMPSVSKIKMVNKEKDVARKAREARKDDDDEMFIDFDELLKSSIMDKVKPSKERQIRELQEKYQYTREQILTYLNVKETYEEKFGEKLSRPIWCGNIGESGKYMLENTKIMLECIENGNPYDWTEKYRKQHMELYGDSRPFIEPML